jgi:hypothetical protein
MRLLPSDRLDGFDNIWVTFTAGYFSMNRWLWLAITATWLVAAVRAAKPSLGNPVARMAVFGPPIAIALFIARSPYAETRFIYPAIVMLFVAVALAINSLSNATQIAMAALIGVAALGTSFIPEMLWNLRFALVSMLAISLLIVAMIEVLIFARQERESTILAALGLTVALAILALSMFVYVYWPAYLRDYRADAVTLWAGTYGPVAEAWRYVREEIPAGEKLAYTNTYFTYPLMGFELDRPVTYVPTRPGLTRMTDLGKLGQPTTGEEIPRHIVPLTTRDPDRQTWLSNLRSSGARWLFIGKDDILRPGEQFEPIELRFVHEEPRRFQAVFENQSATVLRIVEEQDSR